MTNTDIILERTNDDYNTSSDKLYSLVDETFSVNEIADIVWDAVNATADAIGAGMDPVEARLRAAAHTFRQIANNGSDYADGTIDWNARLESERRKRPGLVVPFSRKPEDER